MPHETACRHDLADILAARRIAAEILIEIKNGFDSSS